MHGISLIGVSPENFQDTLVLIRFVLLKQNGLLKKVNLFDVMSVQLDTQQALMSDVFEFVRTRRVELLNLNLSHTIYRRQENRFRKLCLYETVRNILLCIAIVSKKERAGISVCYETLGKARR